MRYGIEQRKESDVSILDSGSLLPPLARKIALYIFVHALGYIRAKCSYIEANKAF